MSHCTERNVCLAKALGQMLDIAAVTRSTKGLNTILMGRFKQVHEGFELAIFPSEDLPIRKSHEQYVWDFSYLDDHEKCVFNGGILFSKQSHTWSSQP